MTNLKNIIFTGNSEKGMLEE